MKPKEEAGVIATNNSVLQGLVLRVSWALPEQGNGRTVYRGSTAVHATSFS
jgi:hypothetical protein